MPVRSIHDTPLKPVAMEGVRGASMALMCGREHGAPNFSLRHFLVEAGGHTPRHSHDYEHEVYVVEGNGTVYLEGREQPLRPGDVVFIPPDEPHQFKADTASSLRFLCLVPVKRNCGDPTPGS
ncbi:MAG: cupin domain-containing protein [Phycisphaeraceae bacterium]|nr:cupin domain-containing protein [Phycisphaeraceae bacterium]